MKRDTNLSNPVTFALKVDEYDMKQMKRISEILGITVASLVRTSVRNYLDRVVEYVEKVEKVIGVSKSEIQDIELKIDDVIEEISPDGFRASEEEEMDNLP